MEQRYLAGLRVPLQNLAINSVASLVRSGEPSIFA